MGTVDHLPRTCLRCKEIETFCSCGSPIFSVLSYIAELEAEVERLDGIILAANKARVAGRRD